MSVHISCNCFLFVFNYFPLYQLRYPPGLIFQLITNQVPPLRWSTFGLRWYDCWNVPHEKMCESVSVIGVIVWESVENVVVLVIGALS